MWDVLLPMEIDPAGPESISDIASCTGMDEYGSYDAALDAIDEYDAIIVRVAELDASVIDRADKLQVIAKHGAGLDNIDIEAASRRGIVVCNTPGANARSVAEHAIALLFGVRRQLKPADTHVRSGGWNRSAFTGHVLTGETIGLVGFGNIAREAANLATGIGMDVVVYDPYVSQTTIPDSVERVETVRTLFESADVISIHAPLTEDTRHLVGMAELDALGENGVLINTSRGPIVDESALVSALEDGVIAGAGLDTFETEPPGDDHPLYDRTDVLLTPHVGGVTNQALVQMSEQAAENVRTVFEGTLPQSTVNREALSGVENQ